MILEFSVGNYRSFKDVVTFSMLATRVSSKDKSLDENTVFKVNDVKLLKSAGIYGANASGKSNLIAAVRLMRRLVLNSSKDTQAMEPIAVEAFQLSEETTDQPSFFEMVFYVESRRYRYGFKATSSRVVSEWLFHVPTIREAKLFERDENEFALGPGFKEGRELTDKTRDNALFLSVVAQFNGRIANTVLGWFKDLRVDMGLSDVPQRIKTMQMLEKNKDEIVRLVQRLDLGIYGIEMRRAPLDKLSFRAFPDELKGVVSEIQKLSETGAEQLTIMTMHQKFDSSGESKSIQLFDIDKHESEGTKKIFSLAGPIIDTLNNGRVLFIDELDARLHPILTRAIIGIFNSNETNPNNAQLVFVTHDTNLLSKDFLRRDQIWFAEKDRFGATHLSSLVEYKERKEASYEANYIRGKYGAIPFLGDLSLLADAFQETPDGQAS